ncbi:hypothetical protein G647_05988 [Cladophialophora carrionii CBS 160.54]|uniref:Uncharacterized protein n=1 Tax=Cladophialophora carrionii CBS 160.54 TaxID=1279043 RepID=V9D6L7_9EURO|nr:uncharacterized protein G647_05988 [Cladophialophora carrionii CBS 160.54]ETI21918.1 hypothetical protein G647_05988 [Cladophialophora carrionii CBS 160.54]
MVSNTHTRSRSKGSFSIFSLDTIRSFSRAGSRQASRIPSKDELRAGAESSLSHRCDPNNQPPPTPEPRSVNHGGEASVESNSPGRVKIQQTPTAPREPQRFNSIRRRAHRLRPKSWLPFARPVELTPYPRSISTQLPKTASTSTVARSVISAPILTSTTNVSVARAEGVHCGEISDAAFSQSTWNSQVGWIATACQDSGDGHQGPPPGTPALSPLVEDKVHRLADGTALKRGRILRLRNVIRNKIVTGPQRTQAATSNTQQMEKQGGQTRVADQPALMRGLSSRRAETINLYKGKIKGLTGNAHIRRRSLNTTKSIAESKVAQDPPLLGDIIDVPTTDCAAEHSDNDSPFGSLTKSFASAVDKLDFYSTLPRNMSFLRSRSSLFSLKKGDKALGSPKDAGQPFPPISPSKPAPPVSQLIAASSRGKVSTFSTLGSNARRRPPVPQRGVPSVANTSSGNPKHSALAAGRSVLSPIVFSNEKNGYVASAPELEDSQGVNPLRMHPPGTMAVPLAVANRTVPIMPADSSTPQAGARPQAATPAAEIDTDSDSISLEDAPIYSPSLGDLSQYARDTPRSAKVALSETGKAQVAAPTPTRSPIKNRSSAKGHSGLLKKSRSGVSLFSRSKPDNNSTVTGGPLHQRDANQKLTNIAGNVVKKSRSLHFGGLFRKDEHTDLQPSAVPASPFQPTTPSPLRKVMRYGSQSTGGGSSPTALSARK